MSYEFVEEFCVFGFRNINVCIISLAFQVEILANVAGFYEESSSSFTLETGMDRPQMMIAFDMGYGAVCIGEKCFLPI